MELVQRGRSCPPHCAPVHCTHDRGRTCSSASRACRFRCHWTTGDPTEEIILLTHDEYAALDAHRATERLMVVLPHRKVWVAPNSAMWRSEPL